MEWEYTKTNDNKIIMKYGESVLTLEIAKESSDKLWETIPVWQRDLYEFITGPDNHWFDYTSKFGWLAFNLAKLAQHGWYTKHKCQCKFYLLDNTYKFKVYYSKVRFRKKGLNSVIELYKKSDYDRCFKVKQKIGKLYRNYDVLRAGISGVQAAIDIAQEAHRTANSPAILSCHPKGIIRSSKSNKPFKVYYETTVISVEVIKCVSISNRIISDDIISPGSDPWFLLNVCYIRHNESPRPYGSGPSNDIMTERIVYKDRKYCRTKGDIHLTLFDSEDNFLSNRCADEIEYAIKLWMQHNNMLG